MKAIVIDVTRCNGCYSCQVVCKDENCGNDWTPYAKPQPETGQFWGKMNEYVRGQVPQVKMAYVFVLCQHCAARCSVRGRLSVQGDYNPGRRVGPHRPGEMHRLPALRSGMPVWCDLLQCQPADRTKMHRLCTPPGHRLEGTPLRRCLPDRRHPFRRRGGYRQAAYGSQS